MESGWRVDNEWMGCGWRWDVDEQWMNSKQNVNGEWMESGWIMDKEWMGCG